MTIHKDSVTSLPISHLKCFQKHISADVLAATELEVTVMFVFVLGKQNCGTLLY